MIRVYLGGSFDPVHEGHLDMVRGIHTRLSALNLPFTIAFLPTAGNPFKGNPTEPIHRLAMLNLACEHLIAEGITTHIRPLEIHQTPPIYTVDTVEILAKQHPNDMQIFVMGGDSLSSLHRWREYERILTFVKIWTFARMDHDEVIHADILSKISTDFDEFLTEKPIFYDPTPIRAISSSHIRQALMNAKTPVHLPATILDYIKQHQLYQTVL